MVKRILVMGAAGALGYSVVREASSAGHGVRAMIRRPQPELFDGLDVEVVQGDAERPDDVERAAEGCDAVAYCINVPLRSWHEKLVPLVDNAIAACAATDARLVFPGNVWIYGPGTPGETVDESRPASPTSRKGRLRAELERRIAEGAAAYTIIEGSGPEERRVIGVASFGEAGSCPSSRDGYNRVDTFLGMIDGAIIASGGCPEESAEACNSIDDDCDGTIDEGCAALGEACEDDADCAFAQLPERFDPLERPVFCGDTPEGRVCTRACDPMTPRTGCGEIAHPFLETSETIDGVYCRQVDGCEGRCLPGEAGTGDDGDSCEADTDCRSLHCADPGDGRRRCLTPCRGGDGLCFEGEVCAAAVGACGGCLPADSVSGSRALGEPCDGDGDCGSGRCLEDGPFRYCTQGCDADEACAAGFHCRDGSCARGERSETGERCVADGDCIETDRCATDGDVAWCTHACTSTTSCPEGFLCAEHLCIPNLKLDGEACSDDDECVSGTCGDAGDRRRCLRSCGAGAPCPSGPACRRLGDSPDGVCAPPWDPPEGGCGVVRPHGSSTVWLLGLLAVLAIGRRRRAGR